MAGGLASVILAEIKGNAFTHGNLFAPSSVIAGNGRSKRRARCQSGIGWKILAVVAVISSTLR